MAFHNISKYLKFFVQFALLLLIGCSTPKTEQQDLQERIPRSIAAPGENWDGFWKSFTTALRQNDAEKIAGMTKLPLFVSKDQNGGNWKNGKLVKHFEELFDEKTKTFFSNITDRDIQRLPSNEDSSKFLHTPIGIELNSVTVHYKQDEGRGSSKTFFFGQIDGMYKLLAVVIAG